MRATVTSRYAGSFATSSILVYYKRVMKSSLKLKITAPFMEFFKSEEASGVILIVCTILSILVANSPFGSQFNVFWHTQIGVQFGEGFLLKNSVEHWVNDGLMAVFFLLIGLEIERELYVGELASPKNATLPIFAAIGGMATPALIHYLFNHGTETPGGAGIPMATDIAFSLGVLALLGTRIPGSLKVFLAAFAIIDDLGAIIVIALFYVSTFSLLHFLAALGVFAVLLLLNRSGVSSILVYLLLGIILWYFLFRSGVHATIAGVLLAFAIPFGRGDEQSPSYKLQHFLHKPVAFLVMPIFAFANTRILFEGNSFEGLASPNSLGIICGLLVGKPLGITLFSLLAVKSGLCQLPGDVTWKHIVGAGFLGGIGFTMSMFIAMLAFESPGLILASKISILVSSFLAGSVGYFILRSTKAGEASSPTSLS